MKIFYVWSIGDHGGQADDLFNTENQRIWLPGFRWLGGKPVRVCHWMPPIRKRRFMIVRDKTGAFVSLMIVIFPQLPWLKGRETLKEPVPSSWEWRISCTAECQNPKISLAVNYLKPGRSGVMVKTKPDKQRAGLYEWYKKLSTGKKAILIVLLIWLAQALPKWTAAITADGELSAKIMKVFVTPRTLH